MKRSLNGLGEREDKRPRPSQRAAQDFQLVFGAVRAWVCQQGGNVSGLAPASPGQIYSTRERCLVADAGGIASGSVLLRVPDNCLMHGVLLAELHKLPLKTDHSDVSLALAILAELKRGADSPYAAYVATLPDEAFVDTLPAWWPDDELAVLLGGSQLLVAARAVRVAAQHDAKTLRAASLLADDEDDRLFFWALACVTSRAFEAGDHGNVMVPILDLLNHRRPRETAYEYHPLGGFVVTALCDKTAGTQVHDSYGAKDGRSLLLNYGFAVLDNAEPDGSLNDTVRVAIKFAPAENGDTQTELLRRERWGRGEVREAVLRCAPHLSYTFQPFVCLLDACRILCLDPSTGGEAGRHAARRRELAAATSGGLTNEDGAGEGTVEGEQDGEEELSDLDEEVALEMMDGFLDEEAEDLDELLDETVADVDEQDRGEDEAGTGTCAVDERGSSQASGPRVNAEAEGGGRRDGAPAEVAALEFLQTHLEALAAAYSLSEDACRDILQHDGEQSPDGAASAEGDADTAAARRRRVMAARVCLVEQRTLRFFASAAQTVAAVLRPSTVQARLSQLERFRAEAAAAQKRLALLASGRLSSLLARTAPEQAVGLALALVKVRDATDDDVGVGGRAGCRYGLELCSKCETKAGRHQVRYANHVPAAW